MSTYTPGAQSRAYHRLPRGERGELIKEINRLFAEKSGVTRKLHPTSAADRELRHEWLRIRDEVMDEKIIEEDMEFRRGLFVSDLAGIVIEDMNALRWTEAAELLKTWSERPPTIKPKFTAPVTDVVKMDWVLTFQRAKTVYDKILSDRIWTNDASRKRIAEMLKKKSRGTGQSFGDLSRAVTAVDEEWINSRPVSGGFSFDALAGALGSFHLQVAISGTVVSRGTSDFEVSIGEVGIYAKDGFHFNDSDFLGFWGHRDEPVNDSDFRQWRTENNAGGDFLVFSDIKRTKLSPPDRVKGSM